MSTTMSKAWLACGVLALLGGTPSMAQAAAPVIAVRLVMTDVQGTPVMKTDLQGNILARYDYRPYGAQQSGPVEVGPGYTGHVNDPDTGLVYMQQRYYDPDVGRFLSVDPLGVNVGDIFNINRFLYVSNNPVTLIDPTGMEQKHPNDMHVCDSTSPCSRGFTVNWSKIETQVDQVFSNYTLTKSHGGGVYTATLTEKPYELKVALTYILISPMGQKVARQAIKEGKTIDFLEVQSFTKGGGYKWNIDSGFIIYTLDAAAWKAQFTGNKFFEVDVPLDVTLFHEIEHTWIGRRALGITTHISTLDNEYEDVRKAENPYRSFYGFPPRRTYNGISIPTP